MYHIKEADIVIIGPGAAGTMAALYVHRTNPNLRIVALDKSKLETSGAIGRGMDALNTMALPPYSYPENVVELLTKSTEGVLNQEAVYAFAKRCPQVVKDLEEIMNREKGDLFPADEKGNYSLRRLHSVKNPLVLLMHAEELKRALAKAIRSAGVEVYDRTPALRIVTEDGRVVGVLGFNIRTGDYFFIKTKAICLTAGCAGRMGMTNSGYLTACYEFPGNSGDGYAMAYEAGAELVSMECFQCGVRIKDFAGPACPFVAALRGGYNVNRLGESIWSHAYASGDTRLGIWKTFMEGKGPVYLKLDHLPEEAIRIIEKTQFGSERTGRRLFHKKRGQDYLKPKSVELEFIGDIGVCGGHSLSGVLGDRNGSTNIQGLYVAGDVDGGVPQSFLGGALAMGGLIGSQAARYAANHDLVSISGLKHWIRDEIDAFEEPLRRDRGLPTNLVEFKARSRIQYYLKPPKSPDFMNIAIWWMERIRREDLPEIKAFDYHDLLKVKEIRSILLVGEMMARASIFREESRWGYLHWRADIPEKKPEWDGIWVVIRKGANGMELLKRKVPPYKWNFPTSMDYTYPALSFGIIAPSKKEARKIESDQWMQAHLDKEGMAIPRRLVKKED